MGASLTAMVAFTTVGGCARSDRAPIAEASVRPGINDRYLDPNLNAEDSVNQFEVESREIFTSREHVVQALGLTPGLDVADIGAGTGLFVEPFARRIGPGGTLYAVDIAPAFIKHMQERADRLGLRNVKPRLCSETSAQLPRASVDLVFVCDTYHHFEYPMSTLASIRNAMRPDGTLVIVDFIREPGISREWVLNHVRAGESVVRAEIEQAGFEFIEKVQIKGFTENYFLRFRRPR